MIPSVESILAATHKATGIDPRGGRRNRSALLSRRVAVYCLRAIRDMSYPEIAEALNIAQSSAYDSHDKARHDPGVVAAAKHVQQILESQGA